MTAWFQLLGGIATLLVGAEVLVRGAVSLALRMKISATTVGLTVVALGTSLPELVIALLDAGSGGGDVAVGGMVGSNFFNIGAVLAISAIIHPVKVLGRTVKIEYPFMLGSVLLVALVLGLDGPEPLLDLRDGVALLVFAGLFVAFLGLRTRLFATPAAAAEAEEALHDNEIPGLGLLGTSAFLVLGPVMLKYGGDFTLDGARTLAETWGLSQYVIGMTVVAFATSAPELAVSVVAAFKKHSEVAIGNVVGSCIFNLTLVLGAAALLRPIPVDRAVLVRDLPALGLMTLLVLPIMISGRRVGRADGVFLLALFVGYYAWLLSRA